MLGGEAAAKAGFTVEEVVVLQFFKKTPIFNLINCVSGWGEFSSL